MKADPQGSAVYVYAIGRQSELRKLLSTSGTPPALEDATNIALVTDGDLAAVVSEAPLLNFGEGRFEQQLKDPTWAADKVMRHEKLAEYLATKSCVVPLRFGVMYSTPELIREMLVSRRTRLNQILERLADREEWGLNVYADRKKLYEQMAELSPKLAEMQKTAKAASPGQAYLLSKKLETLKIAESKTEIRRVVQEIRSELAAESVELKDLPVRELESKQDPAVVAKIAFLIDRNKLKDFRKAAEKAAKKYVPFGFALELTGPWPPYNFSE